MSKRLIKDFFFLFFYIIRSSAYKLLYPSAASFSSAAAYVLLLLAHAVVDWLLLGQLHVSTPCAHVRLSIFGWVGVAWLVAPPTNLSLAGQNHPPAAQPALVQCRRLPSQRRRATSRLRSLSRQSGSYRARASLHLRTPGDAPVPLPLCCRRLLCPRKGGK